MTMPENNTMTIKSGEHSKTLLVVTSNDISGLEGGLSGFDVTAGENFSRHLVLQAGASADMAEMAQLFTALGSLPVVEIIVLFVLYFIGGYLLYASILAAFGAAVNDQQDSQQLMLPVMVIMMFAFYAGFYSADNPEGPFAFWMSFFPFTSSIVMMVRIPFGVPVWQELLSVALLFATDFFILWISAKIYRVGILMYGKKISFKEMCRWVKMS